MRTDAVVGTLPVPELPVEHGQVIRLGLNLVELFVVGTVGAFDISVQLGRLRRKHEQRQLFLLAGQLKFSSKFTGAVDLQSSHRERKALQQDVEEACGGRFLLGVRICRVSGAGNARGL